MLLADRVEFERQVSLICAGYNVPLGERGEAFWLAFNKLTLVDFARIVTHVIGPDGPEKMPTVAQLWGIRKKLAKRVQAQGARGTDELLTALVETAIRKFHLSEVQVRQAWNWIARDPAGSDCAILGVIIPQDPTEPTRFPAHRLMVSELEYRKGESHADTG